MKVLVNNEWRNGFLDFYRSPADFRIEILAFRNLKKIDGLYFIRAKSLRLIWNYFFEIGLRDVLRKILSRRNERFRNQKYFSCGIGHILEQPSDSSLASGQLVLFLAPNHSPCVERIVLPPELITPLNFATPFCIEGFVLYDPVEIAGKLDFPELSGWSSYSGERLTCANKALERAAEIVTQTSWQDAQRFPSSKEGDVAERREAKIKRAAGDAKKTGVLFGYGNYAKTVVLPGIDSFISIDCIHEIDPLQIANNTAVNWDTSPNLRDDERYDAFFIAGYHHAHASLAIAALNQNAYAVVEKPIVVDEDQLDALLSTMKTSTGKLFACFHKRYLPFNKYVYEDLQVNPGDPISYHCIVYEVPLPNLHWYRWPNSKSRLVSNGCHWIDHFLFMNNFCEYHTGEIFLANDGTINCSIELKNGANFTMVLTDQGSERIGVQDYIELRANKATVSMVNGSSYQSENAEKILRKKKINKMESYRNMYSQIGYRILHNLEGDTLESLKVSSELILFLEKKLQLLRPNVSSIS